MRTAAGERPKNMQAIDLLLVQSIPGAVNVPVVTAVQGYQADLKGDQSGQYLFKFHRIHSKSFKKQRFSVNGKF